MLNSAGAVHARADLESINVLLVAPFAGRTQTSEAFPVLRAVASRSCRAVEYCSPSPASSLPLPAHPLLKPDANALHI